MSRTLSGSFETALAQKDLRGVMLLSLELDSGYLYFNNTALDFFWDGQLWVGAEAWGSITETKETLSGEITGIRAELNGLPSSLVSLFLTEHTQGRRATLYFALMDANYQFVLDPVIEFRGLCDQPIIIDTGEISRVQLPIESRMIDFKRAVIKRWNSTDHKAEHPTDTFFDHVENMVDKTIIWPNREFFKK